VLEGTVKEKLAEEPTMPDFELTTVVSEEQVALRPL
jgi:hypothetical protein